ncbi:MAG: hypothetical protein ACRD0I_03380 [Acidimicrobiales bacterium]
MIVPVSLCRTGSALYRSLWGYKSPWVDSPTRRSARIGIASVLARFLDHHGSCIATAARGQWDLVTCVASSRPRLGPHPLAQILASVPQALGGEFREILRARPVPSPAAAAAAAPAAGGVLGHNRARDDGFEVTYAVAGRRVLILDDSFTTGARAHSAASALALAGADVVAVVPVGRVVRPEFATFAHRLWLRQEAQTFTFARCCLEPDEPA